MQVYCPMLADLKSLSGIWRRLHQWHIAWKRGRQKLHSPDPQYGEKVARLQVARKQAQEHPQHEVFFYGDEKTVYRWPPPGQAWEQQGSGGAYQPTAPRGTRSNRKHRWAGMLNATSGQVFVREGAKAGISADDNVALHYVGTRLTEVLSVEPDAKAYRISLTADGVREEPIEPRLLTTKPAGS